MNPDRGWITQQQAAERYHVTERTIRNWAARHRDRLDVRRIHKWTFYRTSELDKLEAEITAGY